MQFSQIAIALLSLSAGASAGCYKRGDGNGTGNGQYGKGLKELNTIDAIAGLLQGYYLANEERTQCAMDTIGNKWKFYLKNTNSDTRYTSKDSVKKWMEAEAYACQYGGKNEKEGFTIIADPNPGVCVDTPRRRDAIPTFTTEIKATVTEIGEGQK